MQRIRTTPRPDWQARCEEQGFLYHSVGGKYWNESACYVFSPRQIAQLEKATNRLHQMCLQACQQIIDRNMFGLLKIPDSLVPQIIRSWEQDAFSIYGRFDFQYDGLHEPKLLEYNADTPTSLLEAGLVQWKWKEDCCGWADQFNSVHEHLVQGWQYSGLPGRHVHFCCLKDTEEDLGNVQYLMETATAAGLTASFLHVEDLGWDDGLQRFVDLENRPVEVMFKLYPWEWMVNDDFGDKLPQEAVMLIEPAWKMMLSNKAILPILWELFPGHENLLPSFFEPSALGESYVRKPLLSREGANITLKSERGELSTGGEYGEEGYIYQAFSSLPCFEGRYPVIGSWVIDNEAAGIGIREDSSPITNNTSNFVPHIMM